MSNEKTGSPEGESYNVDTWPNVGKSFELTFNPLRWLLGAAVPIFIGKNNG